MFHQVEVVLPPLPTIFGMEKGVRFKSGIYLSVANISSFGSESSKLGLVLPGSVVSAGNSSRFLVCGAV